MDFIEVEAFSPAEAMALADGEADPYGTANLDITWAPKDRHVVLVENGRVVAHAGFLPIEVEVASKRSAGVGLGSVMVHRALRGRHVGERLVEETTAHMRQMNRPFAMLFCRDVRLAFYERLGWRRISGEVTVDQDGGPVVMPLSSCWLSFEEGAPPPSGDLRVLGLPF
jgi:predicted N-acetyltransferase YhbS